MKILTKKIAWLVVGFLVLLGAIWMMGQHDYSALAAGGLPAFTWSKVPFADGGSVQYRGFGYSVTRVHRLTGHLIGHYTRMTLETFWQLIDDARHASSRLVEMPQRLIDVLCRLDEQEIVDFWSHALDCMHRSYDARLWLAAVAMMHGCGDDTFSDFRCWLIAQGRSRFEAALEDPDSDLKCCLWSFDFSCCPRIETMFPSLVCLRSSCCWIGHFWDMP